MTATTLTLATNDLINTYGNTAKNVINAYRLGNARAAGYVEKTWSAAVQKAGKRISSEVRTNALSAQKKLTGYYVQGVTLTTDSADIAVNKAVELAGKSLEQVAVNANRFEQSTGLSTLSTVANAAVPAVVAVQKVAAKLEAKSGDLATRIAGSKVKAKAATAKRVVKKAVRTAAPRVRKAAAVAVEAAVAA
ncbi:hypothetical protein [Rhodoferax sp.]|uniref:hypothetical protein n=1 Tax=Rhodoferax sp. TaxID=50421 RepID=UPI0025E317D8|nr:hypothetical protein [Rhodoferax sp.]